MKTYTRDELFALNEFLRQRDQLTAPTDTPMAIKRVAFEYYMVRDPNGVDWMTRKEGNEYIKMFCLESWKRFNWGVRLPRHLRKDLKNGA